MKNILLDKDVYNTHLWKIKDELIRDNLLTGKYLSELLEKY